MWSPSLPCCTSWSIVLAKVEKELLCLLPEMILQDLTSNITKIGRDPITCGGFGDIWKCTLQTKGIPKTNVDLVAVKSLRMRSSDGSIDQLSRNILRELKLCTSLRHRNIIPVYGYTYNFSPLRAIAIVSLWAENGDLEAYLKCQGAKLPCVRRFQILRDIIAGLKYLHAKGIIHGDLTGSNVLILGDGTACLADFGHSLRDPEIFQASGTFSSPGNFRWLAPELLRGIRPNKCSDIYSFGGIILHVLTGKIPYHYLREAGVIRSIYSGEKPDRSRYPAFPDKYWHFIEECWSDVPSARPSVQRTVKVIKDGFELLSSTSYMQLQI